MPLNLSFLNICMKIGIVLKAKLRTHFSDLHTTQDCVKAVHGCKQGTHPMTSYIDEFEELIAGMDGSKTYIQCFFDGLWDLRI